MACDHPRCECMHGPEDCVFQEKNRFPKDCGYPLCPYYNEESKKMDCPSPIEGSPCQGMR